MQSLESASKPGASHVRSVSELFRLAEEQREAGQAAQAKQTYERVLESEPSHLRACLGLAGLAMECGQAAAATPYCRRALELRPEDARVWATCAELALRLGAHDTALHALRRTLELDPAHGLARLALGGLERSRTPESDRPRWLPAALADPARRWCEQHQLNRAMWTRVVHFHRWALVSLLRHGPTRWIPGHGVPRIRVRSTDLRAYRLWKSGGSLQPGNVDAFGMLATLHPSVCIDVGANYGEFSVAAAGTGARTLAIEANPLLVPCLRATLADFPNATVAHAAIDDRDGEIEFHCTPSSTGSGTLNRANICGSGDLPSFLKRKRTFRVPSTRLDALVARALPGVRADSILLKVDVEGCEPGVLRSAERLLGEARWWRGVFEFNSGAIERAGHDPGVFWEQLRALGGRILDASTIIEPGPVLTSTLSSTPPAFCDVLVGRGRICV